MRSLGGTAWRLPATSEHHADAMPILIRDHRNPVQLRSIWVSPCEPFVPVPLPNG